MFYLRLHTQLIRSDPLETQLSVHNSNERDIVTIQSRVSFEGLAFLTKTLPRLGRALDEGLVSGRFNPPNGFKTIRGTSTPAFLQAYFNLVFDKEGLILGDASTEAIRHLRQVCFFAYKLEMPYSSTDESHVIENFIKTDDELSIADDPLTTEISQLVKIITQKVFYGFNHKDIRPRHGPGAVATGEKLEAKWEFTRLFDAIHQVYPYYNYYVVGGARELTDRLDWYRRLQRSRSGRAKVVLVPKDSRGPRLISCEPLEYQWIQQGLGRKLASHLENTSQYTRGRVNFTHQEINRNLAQTSSASERFATLDLKDASDRVSLGLVRTAFERCPNLLRALEACRTTETKLPNGKVIPLNKFAPMGSALCFPVEAYLFWVLIVSAVIRGKNMPLERVGKLVYVYGDDIIIPVEWAQLSIQALEAFGLRVNRDKSCITGKFRESCGMDAYNGEDVTPIRLHKRWSNRKFDGSALASYVSIANKMALHGYKGVSDLLWQELERVYGKIPYGTFRASYPCRVIESALQAEHFNSVLFRSRSNRNYQRIEFYLPRLSSRRVKSKLDDWPRLLRNTITPPFGDPSNIVVPRSMSIKRGWTSVA
jgi:hypothetical protein